MSWVTEATDNQSLQQLLQTRPALHKKYQAFIESLWNSDRLPPRLLELCRLRLAAIHECEEQWQQRRPGVALQDQELEALRRGTVAVFSTLEQQALMIAERMPHSHHDISNEQIADLRAGVGDAGTVALLTALAFFDVNARLGKTLGAVAH